ncbi:MAG: hypothetical protein ACRDGS_06770, partial [Chloroflexota bacterium]
YMRAHKDTFDGEELQPSVFRFRESQQFKESADWAGFDGRTPSDTRQDAKIPQDNAVISLPVGPVRQIQGLGVEHVPIPTNRAHCHIVGDPVVCKDRGQLVKIRFKLLELAVVVIRLSE